MHFELWVSQNLQLAEAGVMDRSEAPVTLAFIPRAMPEELFAKCGAGGAGRVFYGVLHGHDEIAGLLDEWSSNKTPPRRPQCTDGQRLAV